MNKNKKLKNIKNNIKKMTDEQKQKIKEYKNNIKKI